MEVDKLMCSNDDPTTPPDAAETAQRAEPEFHVANAVDDLRQLVAKADALSHAAEDLFERVQWLAGDDEEDRRQLERLAHLLGATAEAVEVAMEAGDELATRLVRCAGGG